MKVAYLAATTANGFISMADEKDYSFTTDADWALYLKELKRAGNFVMGRRTYESCLRTGSFPFDCLNVVMTSKKINNRWGGKAMFVNKPPEGVIAMMKKKGFKTMIITGGILGASFMKKKLVDEVWIDLMPTIFPNGIPVFAGDEFYANLKLYKLKKLPGGELQLRYKVVK